MCFWIFDTKQVKIDKKTNVKTFKVKKKQTNTIFNTCWNDNRKHTTNQNHKALEEVMHGHIVMLMHEYPSSPTWYVRLM